MTLSYRFHKKIAVDAKVGRPGLQVRLMKTLLYIISSICMKGDFPSKDRKYCH